MSARFGAALKQFASTVDIVDETIMKEFANLLKVYLLDELPFNFYEILCDEPVESEGITEVGLRTISVSGGKAFVTAAVEGGRHNHTAYCYVKNNPLWITADNRGTLLDAKIYVDSWAQLERPVPDLPQYKSGNRFPIRTSIIQPIGDQDRPCGVINVESKDHLPASDFAREELTQVADAVSTMVLRLQAQKLSRAGTVEAIEQLPMLVTDKRWDLMQRPKIFVASPDRGEPSVVDAIRLVAGKIDGHEIVVWNDRKRSTTGESRQDMVRGLSQARAAVCYLSEKSKKGSKYVDNPNVLFEAGIADGLRHLWKDLILIPVREHESNCETRIPFDIQALTVLEVPRSSNGILEKKKFRDELRQRLKWLG
jgi:hypothetical protein